MPNITWTFWITIPVGLIMFGIAIWAIRSKKTVEVKPEIVYRSENLTETLSAMHRRLVELQKEKASHTKIGLRQLEKVLPTLADRMGTVKLKDWHKFEKSVKRRIQRAIPQPNFKRPLSFIKFKERAHLAALSVASEIKRELFQSKEWTFEDGVKASEWLDGYHWGVKELRDNDTQWNTLYKSISHYLVDAKLRELVEKHIDLSYIYNNVCLITCYTEKSRKTSFSSMLHETLVGSPISPEKAESALSEILSEIEKHTSQMQEGKQKAGTNIKSVVDELVSIGIYSDVPVNITRILYHDRDKLVVGLSDEVASNQDKLVLHQLNLRNIVELEQRKTGIYGSDNVRNEGYWILTELGKKIILYLQQNKQVLDKEGSLNE